MIPRVAHLIWLQGFERLPERLKPLHESFLAHHGHWDIQLWDYERIQAEVGNFSLARYYRHPSGIVPKDSIFQFQSDLARYEILRRWGGVYVDQDYRWFKPLDPLLEDQRLVTAYEVQNAWVANGFIASEPGHPAISDVMNRIPTRIEERRGQRANRITGPQLWTKVVERRKDVKIARQRLFHSVRWNNLAGLDRPAPRDAYALHVWNHQVTLKGLDR